MNFLTNPNVQRCTVESKERFLRSKGLTDTEIQKALEKCMNLVEFPSMSSELMFFHQSRSSWFRDHVLPFLMYGSLAYGCYWFYKVRSVLLFMISHFEYLELLNLKRALFVCEKYFLHKLAR